MENNLAKKLFFAKEAAKYLNISPQRLNILVKEGKITPLKKDPSGTIFYIDELKKRKEEQNIFNKDIRGVERGMFKIDTNEKKEALNFATLMNSLNITEQKLDPLFTKFSEIEDVTVFMNSDENILKKYSKFFNVDTEKLRKDFEIARIAFSNLKPTDMIVKRGTRNYPPLLLATKQAPRFLYLRGNKALLFTERTVALVGSRQASQISKENTRKLAKVLGNNGITIISGLAKGIDVTAHRSALESGFNTIAVIGTNLNQYYPMENKAVQLEIEKKGLIISQFSPATKTKNWFFPLRNGVMSGLSLATVIMEAGETSGALKQADFALKQQREVIIPKSALELKNITWPEKYIKKGAKAVENSKRILEILADSNIFKVEKKEKYIQLSFDDIPTSKKSCVAHIVRGE